MLTDLYDARAAWVVCEAVDPDYVACGDSYTCPGQGTVNEKWKKSALTECVGGTCTDDLCCETPCDGWNKTAGSCYKIVGGGTGTGGSVSAVYSTRACENKVDPI